MGIPATLRWLFWETDPNLLDGERDADFILARVLEFGGLAEVGWVLSRYGRTRIHRFFREIGHPELSDRTVQFWRAAFGVQEEPWASPPGWRKSNSAPWID